MHPLRRRPAPRRRSLVGLFLTNAILLGCCMFWYSMVYTGSTLQNTSTSNRSSSSTTSTSSATMKGQRQTNSAATFLLGASRTSLQAKKQKLRFHRPLEKPKGELNQEHDHAHASLLDDHNGVPHTRVDIERDADKKESEPHPRSKLEHSDSPDMNDEKAGQALREDNIPNLNGNHDNNNDDDDHPCSKYDALLHIQSGDKGAAAGTLFFQYMINQILYAELYNLMPIIHLNNITSNVYDEALHGDGRGLTLTVPSIWHVPWTTDAPQGNGHIPGKPYAAKTLAFANVTTATPTTLYFRGTGVWNHYFEPISRYDRNHAACQRLPYVALSYDQLSPGIQFHAPWAVRSWEYQFLPHYLRSAGMTNGSLHEWFEPQRQRAHGIIERYYRFRPSLLMKAKELIPDDVQCLAVHIRHSDKGGLARKKIPTEAFLPYVDAYLSNSAAGENKKVYLATDSSLVIESVRKDWKHVPIVEQGAIVRSDKFKPVFRMSPSHHRTNTEVLIDILALARCQFMIHGFSAVSESSHYMNPSLHNRSVDLEDPRHMTPEEFGVLVKNVTKAIV